MKDIERIFKEALDKHEMPFETGAWEALSKRLDGTPSTPFYRKWWFAASVGTILVSSATYFMLQEKPASPSASSTTEQVIVKNERKSASSIHTTVSNDVTNQNQITNPTSTSTEDQINTLNESIEMSIDKTEKTEKTEHKTNPIDHNSNANHSNNSGQTPVKVEDTYQTLDLKSTLCLNEELEILNPNDKELIFVKHLNGTLTGIKPGGKMTFNTDTEGTIFVTSGKHTDEIQVVKGNSKLYINVDSYVIYDDGIPTLKFNVSGNDQSVTWKSSSKATELIDNTYVVHPYNDKIVNVTVSSKDQNGCVIEERTSVKIDEPYNLMAPTGFYPLDFDVRKNRFIPYALTKRNVSFEMFIYDPKNAGVVFKTSDASISWDGIDIRTGEMVKEGTAWPWKVVLKNPNPGEPKEYSGTITRL